MVCLDTTFLVDFLRGREGAVSLMKNWKELNERVSISAPALAEAFSGAAMEKTGRQQALLDELSAELLVLPLTRESSRRAGRIDAKLSQAGEMIGLVDAMIAAVAIEAGEVLITKNLRHFERIEELKIKGY